MSIPPSPTSRSRWTVGVLSIILVVLIGALLAYRSSRDTVFEEQPNPEPQLLYENIQYGYTALLSGGWRVIELRTGKVVAFVPPGVSDTLESREEIIDAGGILLEPQVDIAGQKAGLIAHRNSREKFLRDNGAEFATELKKFGRHDAYIFTLSKPFPQVQAVVDTTPKIILETRTLTDTVKTIIENLEGDSQLFKKRTPQRERLKKFVVHITERQYEEAFAMMDQEKFTLEQFKQAIDGKEDWFKGPFTWNSVTTQGNHELFRAFILEEDGARHLTFLRFRVEGDKRTIDGLSITPALAKLDDDQPKQ